MVKFAEITEKQCVKEKHPSAESEHLTNSYCTINWQLCEIERKLLVIR